MSFPRISSDAEALSSNENAVDDDDQQSKKGMLIPPVAKMTSINRNEYKVIENMFKCLRDPKDQMNFCRLLSIYFEGILNLRDFIMLFNARFLPKLQPQVKDEIEKLLPTRNIARRAISVLIKPWNDFEHHAF